jgi:DNA-binding NtrC family response regulator
VGRLQEAAGGTLFVDEVESLPVELQARLSLAMDEKTGAGNGGRAGLNTRLIFGTQTNLRRQVDAGKFREDLYYRLDAIHLVVPPLRDCREDIPALATHYLKSCAKTEGSKPVPTRISTNVMDMLMTYHWPGNMRELETVLERAVAFAGGQEIQPRDILLPSEHQAVAEDGIQPSVNSGLTETIAGVEQSLIDSALRRAAGNQARAAQFLGIPRTTLRDKMAKYGMVGKPGKKEVTQ